MMPASRRNVFWAGLEAAASGLLSFGGAFVIARLTGPSEFGVGAAVTSVHVLLWVGVNALFSDALVQRSDLDEATAASAFWASTIAGACCALMQAGAGWVLAAALSDSRLIAMACLLALPLPAVGAGGAVQGLLTRRRAYRALAGRAVIGQGLGALTGIIVAVAGCGAWAPVVQQSVCSAAGALALLMRAGWRPHCVCHWQRVRELLRFGLPLAASTFVLAGRYRLFALVLGGTANATVLGETHIAFRLVDTVRELTSTALWRLSLPVLAEHQNDRAALRNMADRLLAWSSQALLPLCGAMALLLPTVVRQVLGPAWAAAGVAALPLVGLMAALSLMFPAGVAVAVRGQMGRTLAGNVACAALVLGLAGFLRPADPLDAVWIWVAAHALVLPFWLWINGRAVDAGLLRPLRAGLPMVVVSVAAMGAATAMPAVISAPLGMLALRMAVFGAVCLGPVLAWNRPLLVAVPGRGWTRAAR